MARPRSASLKQLAMFMETAKVTKKDNRAATKEAKSKADRAKAANIELAQRLCGAAGSVLSGLGEEATSEGRLGRGGGGEEGLGEGGEENRFQKLFATAIGISSSTHSQLQVFPTPSLHPSFGSTLHPRTHSL
jgi:hypothetical protein